MLRDRLLVCGFLGVLFVFGEFFGAFLDGLVAWLGWLLSSTSQSVSAAAAAEGHTSSWFEMVISDVLEVGVWLILLLCILALRLGSRKASRKGKALRRLKMRRFRERMLTAAAKSKLEASKTRPRKGGLKWELICEKDRTCPKDLRKAGFRLTADRKSVRPPARPLPANSDGGARPATYIPARTVARLAVVLDLDGTLIRSWRIEDRCSPYANVPLPVQRAIQEKKLDTYRIGNSFIGVVRPGVERFITEVAKFADVFVATLGNKTYADKIRKVVEGDRGIIHAMTTREDADENSLKDLELFKRDMRRLVIVDDDTKACDNIRARKPLRLA